MKNNTKIIIALVIVATIGAAIYFAKSDDLLTLDIPQMPVVTDSIVGCYVAHLAKDIYTLQIQSEEGGVATGILAYNNFEKDSSSGSFVGTYTDGILLGEYSFNSEGMESNRQVVFKKVGDTFVQGFGDVKVVDNKEVFKDMSKVTYDSKSTFIKSSNCTEDFVDSNNTFSFKYNSFFKATPGDKVPTIDWRVNSTDKGMLLAQVIIPRTYMPKTNFSEARLKVGRSTDAKIIKSCTDTTGMVNQENKDDAIYKSTIDGYPFTTFTTGDAGAGNYYATTSYRGIVDGDCYAIEYTIHSTNVGNYSPDQGIKEFDHQKIQNELDKIIKSFKFIISSN